MKLLFASDLNGKRRSYEFLTKQADKVDAMFWVGNLTDLRAGDSMTQRALVESTVGEIQSRGCRVFASGGGEDYGPGPWHWLERQGAFVAPGLLVTVMTGGEVDWDRMREFREAAWDASALWIVVSRGVIAPGMLTAGAPRTALCWPRAALKFGPDVLVGSLGQRIGNGESDWCQKRAHTWVFNPGGQTHPDDLPDIIILDTLQWSAVRYSSTSVEQRDMSALHTRLRSAAASSRVVLAA